MNKDTLYNEEDFENFKNEMSVGEYINGSPQSYPCVIVWESNEYNYEFVYKSDF